MYDVWGCTLKTKKSLGIIYQEFISNLMVHGALFEFDWHSPIRLNLFLNPD